MTHRVDVPANEILRSSFAAADGSSHPRGEPAIYCVSAAGTAALGARGRLCRQTVFS